jgi:predicted ATPase
MQLSRIRIEKLFGRFDYEITLHRPENITIIHAPNGYGKTALLTLVNAFFSSRFTLFFKYQFHAMLLEFADHVSVEVRKLSDPDLFTSKTPQRVQIAVLPPSPEQPNYILDTAEGLPPLNRFLPFLEPAGFDTWYDENTNLVLSTPEVFSRYRQNFPPEFTQKLKVPDWLQKIASSTECRLIVTERLLRIERTEDDAPYYRRRPTPPKPVVEMEARDLATRIRTTLADYANRSQSLDQSFPRRVIDALGSEQAPEADDISKRLAKLELKRSSLIETGLLDKAGGPEILPTAELVDKQVRQVIGVYIRDTEQKFSRFDELFDRVSLFKEIINEKFQFKNVLVSRETGINVKTDDGRDISLSDLSSGEQHELVLLYELLFAVKDDALILIDEPELSLHVGWQMRFLPDLQRIQKLKPLQIIMATHSPQIINDRWDLTVALKN